MSEFYSLDNILAQNAQYNLIIGERSNGKTYAALEYCIRDYYNNGHESAYIRRWKEDYRGKRGETLFSNHASTGIIESITEGKWTTVYYYSGRWYLARYDEELDKIVHDSTPFCYAFAISDQEHDKSTAYPNICTIVFDEFITRNYYLQNEFVMFANVLSTIIRHRNNVRIFMLANTVNKYCPYFKEMGLKHITEMKQGDIDVYTYGDSPLRVAVEYCKPYAKGKASDVYFTFNNPSLQMITGGIWEIDIYPHLPRKYSKSDVCFTFYIAFDDNLLSCECIVLSDCSFIYIHEKTTPIRDESTSLIFTDAYDPRPNFVRNIRKPTNSITRRIAAYFRDDKVFYQDNEVGEVVRNYLNYCITANK